ncbi:MAG TPA: hypothetical protein VJV78_30105 [Polyangiales bacterium]|nr:hypothetical protein [Polyangiales bacterium]
MLARIHLHMRWHHLPLALAFAACGDNQDPAAAHALWQDIHAQDYRAFQRAPGYEARRHSNAPHGDKVIIYINDLVATALASSEPIASWPEGSLIIKDGFDGPSLEIVAVMQKRSTGWYWAEYAPDGDASYSGQPQLCIDCHGSGADYVRAFSFPQRSSAPPASHP